MTIPAVGTPRPLRAPRVGEAKLRNGLRVLAVRKATVPRVELRLVTPLGAARDLATERVLAKTLTSGTRSRESTQIAQELQGLGASFGVAATVDHFQVSGSVLSGNLRAFLELATDLLTAPTFPADEVRLERARVAQELEIARSQAQVLAAEALRKRLFGRHRYGAMLPKAGAVHRVSGASLAKLHGASVGPRGGVLVLVGDLQPAKAIELVEETLARWRTKTAPDATPRPPAPQRGPILLVDRPGSVQTSIRLAGEVPKVGSEGSYAVDVANTIFGGYFISRWVDNLRERNGYTYSPHSGFVHQQLADYVEISAEVGADVTAPSLVETRYELGRMCSLEVSSVELESAKRYRTGLQSLRIQSQAGLAGTLAALVTHGLGVDYLRTYPRRIAALTAADVREASANHLAPSRLVTVLVGDASRIARDVAAIDDVEVRPQTS